MLPDARGFRLVRRIATKEVTLFFSSPIAYLFLAAFAAVTLFIFFWGEAFFARNIADVRPMFEWMPVLLVFLASTLTMRLWSEERRSGTLEHVLTQPVPLWQFVVGKFLGCLILLLVALIITLPLPLTVAWVGDLDWGPVWAGYLATLLLGAAYLSIGLFVSAKSDNQIVSLISAVALCGVFYLIGTSAVTSFFGTQTAEWLRMLGTGSRFESITRGVIDFRDLYYYLSVIAVFLALNTFVLEQERWAATGNRSRHHQWKAVTALLALNVLAANLWLGQITALRADVTEGNQFSISDATRNYLNQLEEPLLLRGYFSGKTHPLLSPLVPQLRDLMREYGIAGGENVRVEIVDPVENPELEDEARQQYGIEPVPLQVESRYESSIVSSYFNVLVQYGDQSEVLGFQDLIEVRGQSAGTQVNVELRNPEYDLTRAVKTVLNNYQAGGNLFDTVQRELTFNAYVSPDAVLPQELVDFKSTVREVVGSMQENSRGRLNVQFADPESGDGSVAERIASEYGLQPMRASLTSSNTFYFYLTLTDGDQMVQIPLEDLTRSSFQRNLESSVKRFASGFTKTISLVTPSPGGGAAAQFQGGGSDGFRQVRSFLGQEHNVRTEDLSDGTVSGQTDLLMLLAPEGLSETELFAVDQFLMKGGTVIAATSSFQSSLSGQSLDMRPVDSGLEEWLNHHGFSIGESLVMDPENAAFPVPVTRNVGGFSMREWRMLDYPYFVDIREERLNQEHLVTSDLPQVTLAWPSPITVDEQANAEREITRLMHSSERSWLSENTNVMPTIGEDGGTSYSPEGEQGAHLLGMIAQGRFESFFAGQTSPLLESEEESPSDQDGSRQSPAGVPPGQPLGQAAPGQQPQIPGQAGQQSQEDSGPVISSVIEQSTDAARLILISSNDFLKDQIIQLLGTAAGGDYRNSMQLVANNIDWSLEDAGLLNIRSEDINSRTLPPMNQGQQVFWEYFNYVLAAVALAVIALIQRRRMKSRQEAYSRVLTEQNKEGTST